MANEPEKGDAEVLIRQARTLLVAVHTKAEGILAERNEAEVYLRRANRATDDLKQLVISLQHRIDFLEAGAPEVMKDMEFLIDLCQRTGKFWIYYTSLNWSSSLPTTLAMIRHNNTEGRTQ